MVAAGLLGLAAVVVASLGPKRWRSRGSGALRLLVALSAVALAMWSLMLRARIITIYAAFASSYQADSTYYVIGGQHGGGPGRYSAWLQQTAHIVEPVQRAAIIALTATAAFLLGLLAVTLVRWWRRRRHSSGQSALTP